MNEGKILFLCAGDTVGLCVGDTVGLRGATIDVTINMQGLIGFCIGSCEQ